MNGHSDRLNRRHDNLPITAAVQKHILREARKVIDDMHTDMCAYERFPDAAREFLARNEAAIIRKLAAPIESAVLGVTSVEVAGKKGIGDANVLDAEPAENFGELKERLGSLSEDLARAVGMTHEFSDDQRAMLQNMYIAVADQMDELVENIQRDLSAGRHLGRGASASP